MFRTGLSASSSFGMGGGKGGILEKYSWGRSLLWSYIISDINQCQHHDAIVLPNGNVLAHCMGKKNKFTSSAGRKNPAVTSFVKQSGSME
ncbi:MAG: hypothetical protein IPP15_07050 [Saprospiraceae bacterium]|uniref:Uncharacterized protein n=1 Tax=Candidatus Opimibacter skivensis TaxID=2982028 RepID=A0A9D7SRW1_9BACT|nr:hypothetical protein [Candidatus Opimibacter skivensis]